MSRQNSTPYQQLVPTGDQYQQQQQQQQQSSSQRITRSEQTTTRQVTTQQRGQSLGRNSEFYRPTESFISQGLRNQNFRSAIKTDFCCCDILWRITGDTTTTNYAY